MNITEQFKALQEVKGEGTDKVFTMYLNTDPSDPDQQGGKWKVMLKNGLHNFERYLKQDENKEEYKSFLQIKKMVEDYIGEYENQLHKSIIFIATKDEVLFAERLHIRVKSDFYWEEQPRLEQLQQMMDEFPKSGIILVQHDAIKVLETELNETQTTQIFELDVDTEDWKEKVGPRKGFHSSGLGSRNAQIDNFKARFQANKHRWYVSVAKSLDQRAKAEKWEKVFIVGETDVSHELANAMKHAVEKVIHKNMYMQTEAQIMQEIAS